LSSDTKDTDKWRQSLKKNHFIKIKNTRAQI
jgi:hypothetical protein